MFFGMKRREKDLFFWVGTKRKRLSFGMEQKGKYLISMVNKEKKNFINSGERGKSMLQNHSE